MTASTDLVALLAVRRPERLQRVARSFDADVQHLLPAKHRRWRRCDREHAYTLIAKTDARTSGDREHAQTRKKKRDFLRGGDSGSCICARTLPTAACLSVRLHTSSATERCDDSKH